MPVQTVDFFKTSLLKGLNKIDNRINNFKFKIRKKLNRLGPVRIQVYMGFGNERIFYFKGRVLKDRGLSPARDNDTVWQNLRAMYKRFNSIEIPGVRVKARYHNSEQIYVTDKEGYFEVKLEIKEPLQEDQLWPVVELELLDQVHQGQQEVKAKGKVMVPKNNLEFGIISDVDDTILTTGATNVWRMLKLTFLNNARTRLPFAGVAKFYEALKKGGNGKQNNPLFYVSSSPWNLYDLLIEFCEVHEIPAGPFLLRDFGIDESKFIKTRHLAHKLYEIENILSYYPDLNFILIGDSGQHDPEIYMQVIEDFPGRVKAIYIRDVTLEARKISVNALAERMKTLGVPMLLVKDTEEAARHAASNNFIDSQNIPEIIQEKNVDNNAPTDLEQLIGM